MAQLEPQPSDDEANVLPLLAKKILVFPNITFLEPVMAEGLKPITLG
jgi:hypothetical protein